MVLKNVETVDREAYKATLLHDIIPAIKAKWPVGSKKRPIFIQQDNAKPHIPVDDPEILAAGKSGGWDIRMMSQPPNSPDLNVLDLGYFRSIQSLQYQRECRGVEELIEAVNDSFYAMEPAILNKVFLTLQTVMELILENNGSNIYKTPHKGKDRLTRAGELPVSFECDTHTYREAQKWAKAETVRLARIAAEEKAAKAAAKAAAAAAKKASK